MPRHLLKLVPLAFSVFYLNACNKDQPAANIGFSSDAAPASAASGASSVAAASWLAVKDKEYGDSGVVVQLDAKVTDAAVTPVVSWIQTSGPAAVIVNPTQLNANVVLPFVAEPTTMNFMITATANGQTVTGLQAVTALPLPAKASVANPVLSTESAFITVDLNQPVAANTVFKLFVSGGTAVEGVDFAPLPATIVATDINRVQIPITLLASSRSQDVYVKISLQAPNGEVLIVTVVAPAATAVGSQVSSVSSVASVSSASIEVSSAISSLSDTSTSSSETLTSSSISSVPTEPLESIDTDMDGINNNIDPDDDNDGVDDTFDAYPLDADFSRAAITPMELNKAAQFTLYGTQVRQLCGEALSPAGDVNHDGQPDFLVGCSGPSAYLIFGPLKAGSLELSELDGDSGVILTTNGNGFGQLLAGGEDLNGDGIDDIVVSEHSGSRTYVIFGHNRAWPAVLDVNTLDGNTGSILQVDSLGGGSFSALAVSPDINQDGIADLVLATRNSGQNNFGPITWGEALVLYGQAQWPATITLTDSMMDGTNGFKIIGRPTQTNGISKNATGLNSFDRIATGGDFNGDGIPDIAVIDPYVTDYDAVSDSFSRKGEAYVIEASSAVNGVIDLNNPNYKPLLTLQGTPTLGLESDIFAGDLKFIGDLNRDGISELMVGSPHQFEIYLVFGDVAPAAHMKIGDINGKNGFTLGSSRTCSTATVGMGYYFADIGDINKDGYTDFAFSESNCDMYFVVEGGRQQWQSRLEVATIGDFSGNNPQGAGMGFTPGYYGYQTITDDWASEITSVGDLNGDGVIDLIVSTMNTIRPDHPELDWAGSATVIFSCTQDCPLFGIDTDNDGTPDLSDAFPTDPAEALDSDGDGIGNNADLDDDNDGVDDSEDIFPYNPDEQSDSDMDGIGDNADI